MTQLLRFWFGLTEPVSRTAYALNGFGLMGVKYAVEALLIHYVDGSWITPLDYLNPVLSARLPLFAHHTEWLVPALVAWTLPFLWIGVSMTVRRAEDAGRTPFLALLYFVPVVNYVLMLALCVLPSRARAQPEPRAAGPTSGDVLRGAALGVALGIAIALVMVGASVLVFGEYGTTLFVATPS